MTNLPEIPDSSGDDKSHTPNIVKRLRTENSMPGYYDVPAIQRDAADEIERLFSLLKEVDDWVKCLEPFADAGHEPVNVFKKVRAAVNEGKSQ